MLAMRLPGSRGIHAQCSGPRCRAQAVHSSITGRGRPITLARSYAIEANKPDDKASTVGAESENLFKKTPAKDSKSSRSKSNPQKERSATKNSKPTISKNKGADAPAADGANGAKKPKSKEEDDSPMSHEAKADTIKILRQATQLLREFQANPAKFASKNSDEHQGGDNKRSLKTQLNSTKGAPKYDQRQTKIFHETLTVLGDALQIYAQGTAGKDKQPKTDIAAARDATAQAAATDSGLDNTREKRSEKSEKDTADMKQKESPKNEAESEPEPKPEKKTQERQKKKAESQQEKDEQQEKKGEPQQEKDEQQEKKGELQQKKGESQQKSEPQEPTKKKDRSQQKPGKKLKDEAPLSTAKKTKAKKTPPRISDAVSHKIAAAVAGAVAGKNRKGASKSSIKDEAKPTSGGPKRNNKKHNIKIENFRADPASALTPIEVDIKPVPLIQYGLDRVLFKDGVYPLQDPRTRVWNFDPYLANIMPVTDFDFDALKEYITSSKDRKLIGITKDQKKKYTGSTSSMTSTLAHFHFLLSQWRPINCARLSQQFDMELEGFTGIMKSPAGTILNYKDGVYAIDADKEWDTETVLSMLGKSMEKLLTVPKDEFVKYHRSKSHELTEEEKGQEESYHYTTYGDFMMRSQLDAYDPRLPGTGVYDLKTRAVVSIRMDAQNVQKGVGYEIRHRDGNWESFEREYFDMIRSAFLKYSLQVRMGRMDGIFVAFHNTERIFGFQYIPLEEMDLSLHGTTDMSLGDREFTASLKLFNELLNQATAKFPEQSLRVHVETRPSEQVPFLYFFAEPVNDEQIKNIQEKGKGAIEKFKTKLGIPLSGKSEAEVEAATEEVTDGEEPVEVEEETTEEVKEVEVEQEEDSDQVWEDMMDVVEDTMDKDAEGITAIREAIQEALEQSGLLRAKSSEEAQHYVEALLKSIVNLDVEPVKNDSQNKKDDDVVQQSTVVVQQSTEAGSVEPEAKPKQSTIGSLFSWFRPSVPEAEAPAKETTQEDASPEDVAETKDMIKEAESGPSPELVELLVKLTSRVGTTSRGKAADKKAKQQELSDDQARLRSFETILLDMMPRVLESAEEEADEKDAPAVETGDPPAATKSEESKAEEGPLFAMVVTVRNKVNDEPVDRPENLKSSDAWDIEYAMEELHGERATKLYRSCKTRRKAAQNSRRDTSFGSMFDGALPKYINAGRFFRKEENKIAKTQPVWIVGQPAPLRAAEVFNGAGVKLVHVLPSLEHSRPVEQAAAVENQDSPSRHTDSGNSSESDLPIESEGILKSGGASIDQESTENSQKKVEDNKESADKDSIAEAVAELRKSEENKASSFKEWRERSKRQDK